MKHIQKAILSAIDIVRKMVPTLAARYNSQHVHVVVTAEKNMDFGYLNYCIFGDEKVYRGSETDFYELALKKAYLSLRTKMPTSQVIRETPTMLGPNDCLYAGGIYTAGIAIGVSGLPQDIDEMLAKIIGELIMGDIGFHIKNMLESGAKAMPEGFL